MIRQIRLDKGLTQQELADRVGATQGAVSRWEAGRISLKNAVKVAKALGVTVDEILR